MLLLGWPNPNIWICEFFEVLRVPSLGQDLPESSKTCESISSSTWTQRVLKTQGESRNYDIYCVMAMTENQL